MDIAHWAAKHRRSILFLVALLAIGGLVSAFKLPVTLFPQVSFPRIVVSIDSNDQPADQMSISVTRPLEEAIRAVPGVKSMRSTTSRGSAEISINFGWGDDMTAAMLQVDSAINQHVQDLPAGTSFSVRRMDPTVFPIAAYSLSSDSVSLVRLHDIAKYELTPILSSVNGVAKIGVMGGEQAEYRIEVDPDKLNAYGLSLADVVAAVSANNTLQAVGRMEDHYKLFLLLSDTRVRSLKAIPDIVIGKGDNGLIRMEDIARVFPSEVPQWTKVNADGHDAVLVQVYQQPTGNSVQITKDIKNRLAEIKGKLPGGVKLANWYDQSVLVTASAASVRDAILIGVILAAVVLFVFLRSVKLALVALLIVPSVLASTALLLWVLNMSFNIMTLGGMAAAVGLIVDDAIVMIEHIIRRIREQNSSAPQDWQIREAAIEFTRPLFGSSAATIIIFFPLAFLTGVTGAFFKALSMTMASSLVLSFLLAWLAVPLLAEFLINKKTTEAEDSGPIFKKILDYHRLAICKLLEKPYKLSYFLAPLIALGLLAFFRIGSGFMPSIDEGGFILDYTAEAGTSLTETNRLLGQIEQILQSNPAVDTYSRRTGLQLGGGLTEANEGDFFVRLKPFPRPPIDEVMNQIRTEIETKVPGLDTEMAQLMEDVIGDLTAVPQPIEIKLYSDNNKELTELAPNIAEKISKIQGVVDIRDGIVLAGNAINIEVDREKASLEGLNPDQVTQQLEAWFDGIVATQVRQGVKLLGVRVWVPKSLRDRESVIDKVLIKAPDGHRLPLYRIAKVRVENGQPQIVRDNLKNMVAVTGRISGRDMGSTIRDINKVLSAKNALPADVYYELGGLYKQQQIAFKGLLAVFAAALALVFLLLLFLYEEFAAAISILICPLLATGAVFIGLWVCNIELNITAMMGMTMIVGIVTEVSIFYFSEYHDLRDKNIDEDQALIEAGRNRLRPITMTTVAAILALLPLALAIGQGSAMQQPLAVAIISGLLVQIPLVTTIMPVIYRYLKKLLTRVAHGE